MELNINSCYTHVILTHIRQYFDNCMITLVPLN